MRPRVYTVGLPPENGLVPVVDPDLERSYSCELRALIAAGEVPGSAAVYVSTDGSDSASGLSHDNARLTLSGGVAAAALLITAGATAVLVKVRDGGTYTEAEQLSVPANVHVFGNGATFVGSVEVEAGGSFVFDKHFAGANNETMAQHSGQSDGPALYVVNRSDGRGVAGSLTGVKNVRNNGGGGRNFFVRVGILYTGEDGVGIGDTTNGAGHIHLIVPDLYLAGDNALGILGSANGQNASNIIGFIDHILEIGSPSGTVGIEVDASNAVVRIVACQVLADTAFNVSNGRLELNCLSVTGTETHTGGTVVRPTLSTTTI